MIPKWLIIINGLRYEIDATHAWTATMKSLRHYCKKFPKSEQLRLSSDPDKALEEVTYVQTTNFEIAVLRLS